MKRNWSGYRIIIIGVIVICTLMIRVIYPSLRAVKHSSRTTQQTGKELNRNIDHLILTDHARCRMKCRDITEVEIEEILHDGTVNYEKSNLGDERGASFALDGYTREKQHLRVVFAPKKKEMVVVTCIDLDKEWQCDCN